MVTTSYHPTLTHLQPSNNMLPSQEHSNHHDDSADDPGAVAGAPVHQEGISEVLKKEVRADMQRRLMTTLRKKNIRLNIVTKLNDDLLKQTNNDEDMTNDIIKDVMRTKEREAVKAWKHAKVRSKQVKLEVEEGS